MRDDAAIADLTRHFRGELIRRNDPHYDAARRIWNGAIDRYPKLVARCTGGGGNFGVVTSFEYRLHPVGVTVLAGVVLYPDSGEGS